MKMRKKARKRRPHNYVSLIGRKFGHWTVQKYVGHNKFSHNQWIEWRNKGYKDIWAYRYPMGKGVKPEYHYWNQQKLGIIEARKYIYISHYCALVTETDAFWQLVRLNAKCIENEQDLVLFDYDGYNHIKLNMTLQDVINCKERKMGHAFVLYGLLTGEL